MAPCLSGESGLDGLVANMTSPSTGHQAVTGSKRRLLLRDTLRGVSRSFYLSIRVLPAGLREPVGLAYLLARAADTITDTALLNPDDRLRLLLLFRAQVEGGSSPGALSEIESAFRGTGDDRADAHLRLLGSLPQAFALLDSPAPADAERVRRVVITLTMGMEMDLTTFPPEGSGKLAALSSVEDLDRYTYLVAGCVGEFWTDITAAHTPALRKWDRARMSELGVRFGKALQMVNVLRDVPRDLRTGRCYIPEELLTRAGLTPGDLLDSANSDAVRPILSAGIDIAMGHVDAAEEYLLAIPRRCLRLRLAALWPLLLAVGTLAELARSEAWLDPDRVTRVRRSRVYVMIALSLLVGRSNMAVRAWLKRARRGLEQGLWMSQ